MYIERNQAPEGANLLQPGVERRVSRLLDRGDEDHLVPGTHITMEQLHDYQLLGRRLQARATAAALAGLVRIVTWPLRSLVGALGRARREGAAIRELGRLDDRILADIGISRDQIPAAVAGLLDRPAQTRAAAPVATLVPGADRRAAPVDQHPRRAA